MSDFSQTLHDLPWSGLIPVVLLVILGLMLWAAGRRILRPGFAIVGLLVGGLAGWLIGDSINMGLSPWLTAGIAGVVLAGALTLAYRVAVACAMAVIFAVAAPLSVITIAEIQAGGRPLSDGQTHNPFTDKVDELTARTRAQVADAISKKAISAKNTVSEKLSDRGKEHAEQIQQYSERLIDTGKQEWEKTPQSLRRTVAFSAVIGCVIGLFLGFLGTSFSAAAVTALGGSLLWLSGLRVLATRIGVPDGPWLPASGMACLGVWLITAAIGLGIQWTFRSKPADKQT